MDNITIRLETPADYDRILQLTYEAFLTLDYPGRRRMDEHYLIHLLRDSSSVIPELCFVAEQEGEIVGHILYTKSGFKRPDGSVADTITFGPLSVMPSCHKQGIGKALVLYSIQKAKELGFGAVLITGVPDYYPKLGFHRASEYGLALEDGSSPEFFMAYELSEDFLHYGGVYEFFAPEFGIAENDDVGFEEFHRQLMLNYYYGKLMLRPFYENDMALMQRWLDLEHVKRWYEYPADWLNELGERHGEFSFITHMIVEIDGRPIGFCQYYDCYRSREYEDDWSMDISSPGEVYSMDYLLGEPEYVGRGHAKTMIAQLLNKLKELGAKTVIVRPDKENIASNRALEASGFCWDGSQYVLQLEY